MQFDAIGTRWVVETARPLSAPMQRSVYRRVELFDRIYSRFRNDSLVTMLEKKPGTYTFPEDSVDLVRWYQLLYVATDGSLTPLIGKTLSRLGYDRQYSFVPQDVKSVEPWEDVMTWHGSTVTIKKPVSLDFGAAGKGYLVDIIGRMLESGGVLEYVIDASGDVRHRGDDTQVIGLEHPDDPTQVIGTALVKNASLCASATNRRQWGDGLHHVIDGQTARPVDAVVATWVVAGDTVTADGIATALFFSEPAQLLKCAPFEYVRLFSDKTIERSNGFAGELFV